MSADRVIVFIVIYCYIRFIHTVCGPAKSPADPGGERDSQALPVYCPTSAHRDYGNPALAQSAPHSGDRIFLAVPVVAMGSVWSSPCEISNLSPLVSPSSSLNSPKVLPPILPISIDPIDPSRSPMGGDQGDSEGGGGAAGDSGGLAQAARAAWAPHGGNASSSSDAGATSSAADSVSTSSVADSVSPSAAADSGSTYSATASSATASSASSSSASSSLGLGLGWAL